ncbi:MAG TPA: endopeptidase La [Thermoleophilia bacterium]|nr:endopeptidase La [Thermoleophilia bacterium]
MSTPEPAQPVEQSAAEIPEVLPVLPLRDTVVFPDTMIPLTIGQERSIKLIDDVLAGDRMLALVASKNAELETPGPEELYTMGTVGIAHKMIKLPDGTMRILVQGIARVRVDRFTQETPYLAAAISKVDDVVVESKQVDALRASLLGTFSKIVELVPYLPEELEMAAANVEDPGPLAFLIASTMRIRTEEKQQLLEESDVEARLRALIGILTRELDVLELGSKIQSDVKQEIDKNQREYFLRQQMRAIQQELGETDETQAEVNELREQLDKLALPEEIDKVARRELDRLTKIPSQSAEYPVIRTYLDWIITLPWTVSSQDNLDIAHAREILDRDHYDLEKVKDRILEYLAVRKLKADLHGPILCFVGPPGVGKTSLGRSIAEAMGRKFERISVGGVRDEAEIRGHRRTYVGAMPGIVIRAMRDAGTNNPLFMIDEIDKTGADWRGDPSSALLEVLDPEQNFTVRDHYMDLPFDLSKVMFITTANQLEPIPPPLRDRMEIINLAGYTVEEKLHIARNYLVPRQVEGNGLRPAQVTFKDEAINEIISSYTREAGVRNLEREVGTVCRKLAREVAEAPNGARKRFTVNVKRVHELLGRPRIYAEAKRRTSDPGVATGLAWTPVGGDILFIEATAMPGTGHVTVTGQLGDVMKESAQAALSYVRAHARELGVDDEYFQKNDIHIHVPAGAIPKDGPSAGVTMATAICSLVTDTPISSEVAMTGEVTLTGQVLPIGGLKEKTLAAQRAGIHTVILPTRNQVDLEDVPENLREDMTFVPVDRVEQVWEAAMGLTIDGRRAGREITEAHELLEEAQGLLNKARAEAAAGSAAPTRGGAAKTPAKKRTRPAAKKGSGRGPAKAGAKKPTGKGAAKPGARRSPARTPDEPAAAGPVARKSGRAKATAPRPASSAGPVANVKPKAAPARQKGQAKKTTAARGRSGRKK